MSKVRRSSQKVEEVKPAEAEAQSIWGQMVAEAKTKKDEGPDQGDVVALFCGKKRSGKTSLVERFINPQKEASDQPRSTVALDYKYARYASDASSSKSLAHIYDLGGDESQFGDLVAVVVTPETVEQLVLVITLDLSEPWSVLSSLQHWLEMLKSHVEKCLDILATSSGGQGASRVQALRSSRKEAFEGHPDAALVRPLPVPLVIIGTKWDVFVSESDAEKRKWLCRALRYHAHLNGAHLVCTSTVEKQSLKAMQNTLRGLFFGGGSRGSGGEQFDHSSKPIHIPVARDSFEQIGHAGSSGRTGEADWAALVEEVFPKHLGEQKGASNSGGDLRAVNEEISKFVEAAIDGMVEQKNEELAQYRRQAERNVRLASEGIDAKKTAAAY